MRKPKSEKSPILSSRHPFLHKEGKLSTITKFGVEQWNSIGLNVGLFLEKGDALCICCGYIALNAMRTAVSFFKMVDWGNVVSGVQMVRC